MALSSNPTKTRRIERAWLRAIRIRWAEYTARVVERLRTENGLLVNADPFVMAPAQQRAYMVFVEAEIDRLLLGSPEAPNWQAQYQAEAYRRGLETTRAQLIAQGATVTPTELERLAAQGITAFSATPSLGATADLAPIHREGLEFLFQRSYTSLKGWTDKLAGETRAVLFEGFEQGHGVDRIVRDMRARIDVSASRARTIAQTEVNQAYSRSSIAEARRASAEIGKEVKLRWLTVRDSKVRHTHAQLHGVVMTPERASRVKSSDGVNCRCGLAPVIPRADTEAKRLKFDRERAELLALEENAA